MILFEHSWHRILVQATIYRRFGLVKMDISTNPKPTIYRNFYKNMGEIQLFYHILFTLRFELLS